MARRRFNIRFAIWLGSGVAVVACLGAGLRFALRATPQQLVARGDRYAADGNFTAAHESYSQALSRNGRLVDVMIKDGDVMAKLAEQQPDKLGYDYAEYHKAALAEPNYLPAQQRLLDGFIVAMRHGGSQPSIYASVHEAAQGVHQLKPDDVRAEAFCYIAPLIAWTRNIPTPDKVVADDFKALQALLPRISADPDVRFYTACVFIRQGQDLARQGDNDGARKRFDQAFDVMSDGVKAAPENADMHLGYALILEDAGPSILGAESPAKREAASQEYLKKLRAEFAAARQYATPADPLLIEIYSDGAGMERRFDQHKAEAICHDLLKLAPDNQKARQLLADVAVGDPAERDEVISILRQPIGAITNIPWGYTNVLAGTEYQTNLSLEQYLLDSYNVASADGRKELISQIQDLYQTLADHEGTDYRVLKLRGMMEAIEGGDGTVKAVQTLEAAQRLATQKQQLDLGLDQMLVESYLRNRQTGPAKMLLQQMITAVPNVVEFRLKLGELLLDDHDTDGASAQLDKLTQIAPNDARVQNLMMRYYLTLQQQGDPAQARESVEKMHQLYAKLPESSPPEQWDKSILALQLGDYAEAERLLLDLHKKSPTDGRVVQQLTAFYQQRHENDKAVTILNDAIANSANTPEVADQFKLMLAQVNGEKSDQIEKLVLTSIEHIPDEARRELRYYEFYREKGNATEALKHLAVAEKADPKNTDVQSARLQIALDHQNWDEADRYAHVLSQENADHADGLLYQFGIAEARQDINKEVDIARQMTQTRPEFSKSWELLGKAMEARGRRQNDNTSFDEAIYNFGMALDKQSENQDALLGIIECYLAEGKSEAAREYIQRGLKLNPSSPLYREQAVQYELAYGDPHNAVAIRRQQLDSQPNSHQTWLLMGGICVECVRYDVAHGQKSAISQDMTAVHDTVNDALKRWPDERAFYNLLAQASQISGDIAGGEAALKTIAAHDLEKQHLAQGTLMLANFYASTGKTKDAVAVLVAIRNRCLDDELVELKLASLYADEGRLDESLKVLDPKSPDSPVQEKIARLLLDQGKFDQAREVVDRQLDALASPSTPASGGASSTSSTAPSVTAPATTQPLSFSDTRTPGQRESMYLTLRAYIDFAQKHKDQGVAEIDKALQLDPHNPEALISAAGLAMQQAPPKYNEAINYLSLVRELHPEDIKAQLELAEIYYRKGDLDSAVRELEQARQQDPFNKTVSAKLLSLYAATRPPRWLDEDRLLTTLQSTPEGQKDPDWFRIQAGMWMQRNDAQKAVDAAQKALALAPNDSRNQELLAQILMGAQRYPDVISVANQLLGDPHNANGAWIYQVRALAEHKLGQDDASSADFQRAFAMVRQSGNATQMVGLMLQMSDELGAPAALAAIQPLLAKADKDLDTLRLVTAYLYVRAKDGPHATAMVDAVLANKSKFAPDQLQFIMTTAGDICMLTGDVDRAQAIYRQVLTRWPDNVEALNDLSNILCDHVVPPRTTEALKYTEHAVAVINPDSQNLASILDTRGWALTLAGQLDQGIDCLLQALNHRDFIEAHYHLGQAYFRKKMFADAVSQLQTATKMVNDLRAQHQTIDPSLESEIENALSNAREAQSRLRAQAGT